jgi:hypothetical protein
MRRGGVETLQVSAGLLVAALQSNTAKAAMTVQQTAGDAPHGQGEDGSQRAGAMCPARPVT